MQDTYILIAAYNEEGIISDTLTSILKYQPNAHIVVVDDGSSDRTVVIAKTLTPHALRHRINCGKTSAMATAIAYLKKLNVKDSSLVVCMDADGQHDPSEIRKLLTPLQSNKDNAMVLGVRTMSRHTPLINKVGRVFGDAVTALYTGEWYPDSQCGYRAIRWSTLREFYIYGGSYTFETQCLREMSRRNLAWQGVPVSNIYTSYTRAKSHKQGLVQGLKTLLSLVQ